MLLLSTVWLLALADNRAAITSPTIIYKFMSSMDLDLDSNKISHLQLGHCLCLPAVTARKLLEIMPTW